MGQRFLFLLFLCLMAISAFAQRQQPFEGIITYLVKTELKQEDHPYNKYYAQKYGDTLTVYYHKNGSERRNFSNTGPLGLDFMIYNKINNEQYSKWHSMDSVFYYGCAQAVTKLDTLVAGDTLIILGKTCPSIRTVATDINSGEVTRQTLYYSGEEYAPPHTYANRKDSHIYKMYAVSQSHFLRWDMDLKYTYVTFEAISIERTNVDPNLFIIPTGIAKVKM